MKVKKDAFRVATVQRLKGIRKHIQQECQEWLAALPRVHNPDTRDEEHSKVSRLLSFVVYDSLSDPLVWRCRWQMSDVRVEKGRSSGYSSRPGKWCGNTRGARERSSPRDRKVPH
jgi:hypothetical protein